ncbi:MAG: DUF4350 domain-containing protein [Methanobacteriota archaeon]
MRPWLVVALLVAALVGAGALLAALGLPDRQLSAYGSDWNDVGAFRSSLSAKEVRVLTVEGSVLGLDPTLEPSRTLVAMIGVEREIRGVEADRLEAFVADGGRLIVANDFGDADPVALRFGARFDRVRLYDEDFAASPDFVRADANLSGTRYDLLLNVPTSLTLFDVVDGGASRVLAASTDRSYVDLDENGAVDLTDVRGPFPLLVLRTYPSGGAVLLAADPGLFIDGMRGEAENAAFLDAVVEELLPEGGVAYFDESSHAAAAGGAILKTALAAAVVATSTPAAAAVLLAVALAIAGGLVAASRSPAEWAVHDFRADEVVPRSSADDDAEAARALLLWRVAHGLSAGLDEARRVSREDATRILGSPAAASFLLDRDRPRSREEIQRVLDEIGGRP